MAIQKLNKTFVKGAVLKADELNDMVSKTNEIIDSIDDKIGATYFDAANLRQLQFKSAEDRDAWLNGGGDGLILRSDQFSFSGTISQVKITDEYGSKQLYFTNIQPEAKVTVSFISQTKSITDTSWTEVYEDFVVSVGVDKGATGNYTTIINNQTVMNGNTLTFDIKKYIAAGNNRVRITAIGKETGEVATSVYSATLTSMYLTPSNFAWHVPFVEGTTYQLGGMNIGGSISKKVMVRVTNTSKNFTATYEKNIGTATYTTNAYFFTGMEFPRTGTGTYQVEIWLDANGLESDHLVYNIMCIAKADINTAQAVCINDIQKAVNGVDSALFRYAVYNKNTSTASPTIRIEKGGQVWKEETLVDVATGSAQTYSASLEFDDENPTFYIDARVTLGSATQEEQISVDNSASFPAVAGASWYLNAATRNNAQVDKEKIVNEMNGNTHNVTWTNMAWVDGTDGWTTDDSGRKCLLVPARSKGVVSYNPLSDFKQAGKTIEIAYKVSNAADYNENIITIATNPTASNFKGIIIKPKKIIVHSNNLYMEDEKQSYPTKEDELMHVAITIIRDYQGNRDYNICIIYVNGIKKCSFEFTSSDTFLGSNLIVGSETADLSIYKMRVYDSSFGWQDVVQNYINCLPSQSDKIAAFNKINSVIDDSYNIDYDAVYGKYNTMVIEMKDDAPLPDLLHQSGGNCDMWINILNPLEGELDSDFASFFNGSKIANQPIEGQGTTAMTYYRWNFRWKMTSDYNKRRITAKKNVASSMQDHKMGATRMYNDLNRAIVGANEANAKVAVFQYPVYGFERKLVEGTDDEYIYEFIGVYTIGPDKGDKPTFGYNNNTYKTTCIHMEGTDHTPKVVGMDYPWEATRFSGVKDVESIGAIISSTTISKAWEVGMAGDYATDDVADEANVQALLDREFKPAYNVAYYNSTLIEGVTQSLATINSDISAWRAKKNAEGMTYENLEFWTDGVYDLYYYNQQEKVYKATGINLLTDLGISASTISGMTLSQKNEYFKTKRRERFKTNMGKYWHLDDCIFHYTFCMMFAATDNYKKNTYPYKFASLANGGKWRWRQDDLDTLFDINNQGFSAKSFSVLVGDQTSTGSGSVYRGDDSAFWILIRECYKDEIQDMVHRIMNKMDELSPYGSNNLERIVGYVKHCCWDMAQEYFTASAYNEDAEWTYERAWFLKKEGQYNHDVHPLQQSLGSHYEAERDWVELRIVFLASYFQYGAFAADHGNDNSTGTIKWRGIGTKTYNITTALDINPTILVGQNLSISAQKRVLAGETFPLVAEMGSSDTDIYIQGADYYSDLGDLDDLQISADSPTLNVSAKRLRRLKVGDAIASNVTSNIKGLVVGDCPSMESVDARNLVSLVGDVSLEGCKRLREALFGGTSISQLGIAAGSKIEKLSLPNTLGTLSLVKLMNLKEENVDFGTMENISFIRVEKNAHMDGFEMLKAAYNNSDALRNIRIVGFDYEGGGDDLIMISNFATATDENGERKYFGIDDEGRVTSDLPVLDGSLKMAGNAYESDFTTVKLYYPHLNISVDEFYIDFVDKVVQQICATTWGDGVGLTPSKAATITSLGSVFRSNTEITSFNELELFTGLKSTSINAFRDCTNLVSVRLPEGLTQIAEGLFRDCTSLTSVNLPESLTSISSYIITNTLAEIEVYLPNLTNLGSAAFNGSSITKVISLGKITKTGTNVFFGCKKLTEVTIPETLLEWGNNMFEQAAKARIKNMPQSLTTIGATGFQNQIIEPEIYLPNLVNIGNSAFAGSTISRVTSLGNITQISKQLFDQAKEISFVAIPSNVTSIGDYAFRECSTLVIDELNLPKLTSIGLRAFQNVKISKITNLGTITSIPEYCFNNNPNLISAVLPETVTELGKECFNSCTNLTSINLPKSIITMGDSVLANNTSLNIVIDLPNLETMSINQLAKNGIEKVVNLGKITTLGAFASDSPLKSIVLPSTLQSITYGAFQRCYSLESVVVEATTPPTLNSSAFINCNDSFLIYAPNETYRDYRAATTWINYASRIFPIELYGQSYIDFVDPEVKKICLENWDTNGTGYLTESEANAVTSLGTVFKGNTSIINFDELEQFGGIASIGSNAFYECTNLESVKLSEKVHTIDTYAFRYCSSLKSINLDNVETLKNDCFRDCTSLEEVNLPNLKFMLNGYAFASSGVKRVLSLGEITALTGNDFSSTPLEYIELPTTIRTIGWYSFTNCSSLTSFANIKNLEYVTKMNGQESFRGTTNLKDALNLPNLQGEIGVGCFRASGITSIDNLGEVSIIKNLAFMGCYQLTKVVLPSTLTEIMNEAFDCTSTSNNKCFTFVIYAVTPPTLGTNVFRGRTNAFIYVPDESVEAYKSATNWIAYASMIKGISELPTI